MNISTLSQAEAEQVKAVKGDALISIATPDTKTQKFPAPNLSNWGDLPICQVKFHDVIPENGSAQGYQLMTTGEAERIIRFIRNNQNAKRVFIHCWAGKSRSKTIAKFLEKFWDDIGLQSQPRITHCEPEEHKNRWVWYQLNKALLQLYFQENFFTKPKESNGNE